MATNDNSGKTWVVWYYDLAAWRPIETILDEEKAEARARHLRGREDYLRVAPSGATPEDYLRVED